MLQCVLVSRTMIQGRQQGEELGDVCPALVLCPHTVPLGTDTKGVTSSWQGWCRGKTMGFLLTPLVLGNLVLLTVIQAVRLVLLQDGRLFGTQLLVSPPPNRKPSETMQ